MAVAKTRFDEFEGSADPCRLEQASETQRRSIVLVTLDLSAGLDATGLEDLGGRHAFGELEAALDDERSP